MLGWGGYATQAAAQANQVVPIPDSMSFEHAAAFTIVYQTSYFALVFRAPIALLGPRTETTLMRVSTTFSR